MRIAYGSLLKVMVEGIFNGSGISLVPRLSVGVAKMRGRRRRIAWYPLFAHTLVFSINSMCFLLMTSLDLHPVQIYVIAGVSSHVPTVSISSIMSPLSRL